MDALILNVTDCKWTETSLLTLTASFVNMSVAYWPKRSSAIAKPGKNKNQQKKRFILCMSHCCVLIIDILHCLITKQQHTTYCNNLFQYTDINKHHLDKDKTVKYYFELLTHQ